MDFLQYGAYNIFPYKLWTKNFRLELYSSEVGAIWLMLDHITLIKPSFFSIYLCNSTPASIPEYQEYQSIPMFKGKQNKEWYKAN